MATVSQRRWRYSRIELLVGYYLPELRQPEQRDERQLQQRQREQQQ
jgi:hypothetical protein